MAVQCSQCGTENQDRAEFCANCGAPLEPETVMGQAAEAIDRQAGLPIGSIALGLVCLIYLINPTAGFLELIPDNLPILGNLDEGLATVGLLISLGNMGIIKPEWIEAVSKRRRSGNG